MSYHHVYNVFIMLSASGRRRAFGPWRLRRTAPPWHARPAPTPPRAGWPCRSSGAWQRASTQRHGLAPAARACRPRCSPAPRARAPPHGSSARSARLQRVYYCIEERKLFILHLYYLFIYAFIYIYWDPIYPITLHIYLFTGEDGIVLFHFIIII